MSTTPPEKPDDYEWPLGSGRWITHYQSNSGTWLPMEYQAGGKPNPIPPASTEMPPMREEFVGSGLQVIVCVGVGWTLGILMGLIIGLLLA